MRTQFLSLDALQLLGQKALVRVDFNVPIKDGVVTDVTRIESHIPTIQFLLNRGAQVILMSHLGRPKGKPEAKYSLEPVAGKLQELLGDGYEVIFSEDCTADSNKDIATKLKKNQVLLLENLRFYAEEEKDDAGFAQELARVADVYVNDAFGACHRAHASVHRIASLFPKNKRAAGLLLSKELNALSPVLEKPVRPLGALLGGAKVSDKIKVIESFIQRADIIMIGGAMAYTFLKAKGIETGKSLVEDDQLQLARRLMDLAVTQGKSIYLPEDHVVVESIEAPQSARIVNEVQIPQGMIAVDIGPKTIATYTSAIGRLKTIVWNGPMGIFETDAYSKGTVQLAKTIAQKTQDSGLISITGGGDSIAALAKAGVAEALTHVSTGGGASLEFLEGKKLPGVAALE